MDPLDVVFTRSASRDVEEADAWWRENRSSAPDLFLQELERMVATLALVPNLGAVAVNTRLPGVRRVLLRRTGYLLYYRPRESLEIIEVRHSARSESSDR